jgi:hypothetical protein
MDCQIPISNHKNQLMMLTLLWRVVSTIKRVESVYAVKKNYLLKFTKIMPL